MSTTHASAITAQAARLLDAERKHGNDPEGLSPQEDAEISASIDDDTWLAAVAIILSDYIGDLEEAVDSIEANRDKCLAARGMGFQPSEMAQYAVERMGLL